MLYFLKNGMKNLQHLTYMKIANQNLIDFVVWEGMAGNGQGYNSSSSLVQYQFLEEAWALKA